MSEKIITLNEDAVKTELKDGRRVSIPPTFKPKTVNGKRLVAANYLAKIFYNVVVQDTPLKDLVRKSVEETLNELLDSEAEELTGAGKYERSEARKGYRSGHYTRNLTTTSGNVKLSG